jgi:glycosyltransferase involved in cell wall biosynthesis
MSMRFARNAVQRLMGEYGRFDGLCTNSPSVSPSISVIIPAYNEAGDGYMSRAIESVLGEGRRGYKGGVEVLVVDDGSTDRTAEIAKGYEGRGVRVLQTKNMGIAHARNYGACNATGGVIVFMDADSRMEPGLLGEVAGRVRKGYVGGTARTTPDTNGPGEGVIYSASNAIAAVSNALSNLFYVELNPVSEGGFIFCTRAAFEKIKARYGDAFPDGTSEDRAFVYRLFEEGLVARLADTGIVTSSRRTLKNGFAGTVLDKLERYRKPVGVPFSGYEAVRKAA